MKPLSLLLAVAFLASCGGGLPGLLLDRANEPVSGQSVRLIEIDDEGNELSTLETAITDESGRFKFDLGRSNANASLVVTADISGDTLRGFLAGTDDAITVDALSEGLVSLVVDITSTEGGRTLADFQATEIRAIGEAVLVLDATALDRADSETVKDFLRLGVGRRIAEASGGAIEVQSSAAFGEDPVSQQVAFEADTGVCSNGALLHLLEGSDFRFGVEENGALCEGTSATLSAIFSEGAFTLTLIGRQFYPDPVGGTSFPKNALATYTVENERQIKLGPYALLKPQVEETDPTEADTLTVTRKIYVPTEGNFIRYLDRFENTGELDQTVTFEIGSFLATFSNSAILSFDPDADGAFSTSSRFFSSYDSFGDRPTAGFVVQDGNGVGPDVIRAPGMAGGEINEVTYGWTDLTVPAGESRSVLHFGYLTASRSADEVDSALSNLAEDPDMTGLSLSDVSSLLNFAPNNGTLLADAGYVIGRAEVTASNAATGETLTVSARPDGSFAIPLDTVSGDEVHVTASDGLDTTLTVP